MMALLGGVGFIIGAIAKSTIDEATTTRLQAELDALADTSAAQPTN